jgi:putative phosphoribosyl transferase
MSEPKIISTSSESFADREEAGRLLADELSHYQGRHPVVLGIPRGGIVVACALAEALGGEPDIVLSRKLRTPHYPELAMGSVSEDGRIFLNERVVDEAGIRSDDIEREKERQLIEIKRRGGMIRDFCPKIPRGNRVVIVTDDGVATGATFQAALWAVRDENPGILAAAIPVGSEEAVRQLAEEADELLCLRVPPLFAAVGQFYNRFETVEDEDVLKILKEARKKAGIK